MILLENVPANPLLPYLGLIGVFLAFTLNQVTSYTLRQAELKRIWYMKAFIEPNNSKIVLFFDEVFDLIHTSSNEYIGLLGSHPDPKTFQLQSISKFQDIKQKFEFIVVSPLEMSHNFGSGFMPSSALMDMEDKVANYYMEIAPMVTASQILTRKSSLLNELTVSRMNFLRAISYPLRERKAFPY